MRLKDKKIIVTAAAQGIGRATALKFADEGASVIATDINEEKLIELNKENNSIKTQKLDATDKNAVEEFCSTIDVVDVLFHAVGFVHHGTLLQCDETEFHRSINVNVFSAYFLTPFSSPRDLVRKIVVICCDYVYVKFESGSCGVKT